MRMRSFWGKHTRDPKQARKEEQCVQARTEKPRDLRLCTGTSTFVSSVVSASRERIRDNRKIRIRVRSIQRKQQCTSPTPS